MLLSWQATNLPDALNSVSDPQISQEGPQGARPYFYPASGGNVQEQKQNAWGESELAQLLALISNIHLTMNSIPPGTRLLLEHHGFNRGRLHGFKRSTYKLRKALIAVTGGN